MKAMKVLEVGGLSAGYFGRLFAQQGATVARVDQQARPPAWVSGKSVDAFLHANKTCFAGASPVELSILADDADIVVCEAETADELIQLGFDTWATKIKVAITPFGRTGPKRNWQATPATLLAMGGYTHLIGDPDRMPLSLPGHFLEFQTAAMAFSAAAATFFDKRSDVIDISMLESVLSLTQFTSVRWHCAGKIRERHGNDFYFVVPSNLFRTRDGGWVYVNIVSTFWDAFTVFLDLPELLLDERFETNDLRIDNRHELYELAASVIGTLSREECTIRAEAARIPFGVVQSFPDVLDDPHLAARNFWQHIDIDIDGQSVRMPRGPYHLHGRGSKPVKPQTMATTLQFPDTER